MKRPSGFAGGPPLAVDALYAALPPLATVSLYLPSGAFMPFRWVTAAIAVLAVAGLAARRPLPAPRAASAVGVLAVSFAVFGAIGTIRYPDMTSTNQAINAAVLVGLALATALLAGRVRTMSWFVLSWMATALVAAAVGAWELATARHLPRNSPAQQFQDVVPGWNEPSSFFDNPNLYAFHIAVTLLLLPVAVALTRGRWRWLWVPFAALELLLLARTDGRIALLGALLGGLAWALRTRRTRTGVLALLALFVVAVLARVRPAISLVESFAYAWESRTVSGSSTWVRMHLIQDGVWIVERSGWIGAGPGGFDTWTLIPGNPHNYEGLNNAHSGLVEVLAEYGVVTFALLVLLLVAAVVAGVRTDLLLKREGHGAWSLPRTAAFAGAALALAFPFVTASHSTWLRQPVSVLHVVAIVLLLGWAESSRRSRPAPLGVNGPLV